MPRIFKRPGSQFWHCAYSLRGHCYRESTEEADEDKARKYLQHRLDEIGADKLGLKKFVGPASERITMDALFDALKADYELRRIKALRQTLNHLKHAKEAFGLYRANEISSALVDDWLKQQRSKDAGLEPSTLNRRLSCLIQALKLAYNRGQIARMPMIRKLRENPAQQGFFEKGDFERLVEALPEHYRDFCRFAYLTGWRLGAVSNLKWADADLQNRAIRLRAEHDKTGKGGLLALEGELWELMERRKLARECPRETASIALYVFHREGRQIKSFYKAWYKAETVAGLPHRHFHDFRRTAARNMVFAGVPAIVAMSITGHRTQSMLDRYSIVSLAEQRKAQNQVQEHLKAQPSERKVVSISQGTDTA